MDRLTDRPYMTSAVYRGRKASTQTNIQNKILGLPYYTAHFAVHSSNSVGYFSISYFHKKVSTCICMVN